MSSETTVLCVAHICERDVRPKLRAALLQTGGDVRDDFADLEANVRAGGHGGFGLQVFALCSRCLYLEEFLENVEAIHWEFPDSLLILKQHENDDVPYVVRGPGSRREP